MEREAKPGPAGNESICRETNEGIQRGQWPGDESRSGYLVVEKRGQAEVLADESDPRR